MTLPNPIPSRSHILSHHTHHPLLFETRIPIDRQTDVQTGGLATPSRAGWPAKQTHCRGRHPCCGTALFRGVTGAVAVNSAVSAASAVFVTSGGSDRDSFVLYVCLICDSECISVYSCGLLSCVFVPLVMVLPERPSFLLEASKRSTHLSENLPYTFSTPVLWTLPPPVPLSLLGGGCFWAQAKRSGVCVFLGGRYGDFSGFTPGFSGETDFNFCHVFVWLL